MFFNFGGGMPGGGHGHGHGHGHGGRRGPAKDVDNTKFYTDLGIDKNADADEVRRAFRKAALTHHPDRGGDPEKFKAINKAAEVLGNPEKRALYDEGGEEAVEAGGSGGGPGGMDIFDLFGGGMFGGGGRERDARKKRGEDVTFPLKVRLDDCYSGTNKKLNLTKNILCAACKGSGGKNGIESTCTGCKGQGVRMVHRQIGPGMVQQIPSKCAQCSGTGSQIAEKDKCTTCHGAKTIKEKRAIEVFVTKGMKHGERIVYKGEADEAPNTITGDVVVILQVIDHPLFRRDGPNLFIKKSITLIEALTGFSFSITHLDGRVLKVVSEASMIVKPGEIKCVRGEGMPQVSNPYNRGDLFVEMDVIFPTPKELDEKAIRTLTAVLPRPANKSAASAPALKSTPPPKADGTGKQPIADHPGLQDTYEVQLHTVDMKAERMKEAQRQQQEQHEQYEEDEDDEGHGHGHGHGGRPQAGCNQQ